MSKSGLESLKGIILFIRSLSSWHIIDVGHGALTYDMVMNASSCITKEMKARNLHYRLAISTN